MQGTISFLGSGDLYMDRLTSAGVAQGSTLLGNATAFELSVEADEVEQLSNKRDTYGQTITSSAKITGSNISITLNQYDVDVFAAAFMGEAVALSDAEATVETEAVTAILDKWVDLGAPQGGVSAVVVQDDTDTTTYVLGTDYEINPRLGMIKALSTGSISASDVLHVDYTAAVTTGYKITGATQSTVKVKFRLDGKNVDTGDDVQVNVFEAVVKPGGAIDFLGEEYGEVTLEGKMLTPSGKSWPFEII